MISGFFFIYKVKSHNTYFNMRAYKDWSSTFQFAQNVYKLDSKENKVSKLARLEVSGTNFVVALRNKKLIENRRTICFFFLRLVLSFGLSQVIKISRAQAFQTLRDFEFHLPRVPLLWILLAWSNRLFLSYSQN